MAAAKPVSRYAVIDLGSIAVRLRIGTIAEGNLLTEVFTRVPLGLGRTTYGSAQHVISAAAIRRLTDTLTGMRLVINAMKPCRHCVVATAAVRDAANRRQVVERVRERSGIRIRVLSGREEAAIIGGHAAASFPATATVVNTDIGGGSTDCAVTRGGQLVAAATFTLGTTRAGGGSDEQKRACHDWLAAHTAPGAIISASGGSARVLQQSSGALTEQALLRWQRRVRGTSPTQLAVRYEVTPDRAAHMADAVALYRLVLRATAASEIHPVQAGLSEALIWRALTRRQNKAG